jgi:hypothetical protein
MSTPHERALPADPRVEDRTVQDMSALEIAEHLSCKHH